MALATKTRPSGVEINLLPQEMASERRTKRTFRMAVYAAMALAVLMAGVSAYQRMQISDAEGALAAEQATAANLRLEVSQLAEFERLQVSLEQNRALLGGVLASDIEWSRFLNDLDLAIPAGSWLNSLTVTTVRGTTPMGEPSVGTVQYQGYVTSFPGLAGWLDTMSDITGLRFVYLSNGTKQDLGGREVVSFSASAHLTEDMLSGRCQQEGLLCP